MKKTKTFIMSLFFIMFLTGCTQSGDPNVNMTPRKISSTQTLSTQEVVENVKSAVVGIAAYSNVGTSVGSGVAISEGGYVLTNHHVVAGAVSISLYFADKTQGSASYIWSDSSLDLAIIKSNKNLPYLEMGNSQDLKVGEDVIAIGTPLTLQFRHTVTKGIVSALNRTLEVGSISDANYLQNLIQHDASINPGNSGGPLISMDCKLVGINTLKAQNSEGIGFAIPIEVGQAITTKIVANNDYIPAYIGLFGFDAQIASFYQQTSMGSGVYIVTVDNESPAVAAGIQKGDIITRVGNKKIETVLDLRIALYNFEYNDRITIAIMRDGKEIIIELNAGKRG